MERGSPRRLALKKAIRNASHVADSQSGNFNFTAAIVSTCLLDGHDRLGVALRCSRWDGQTHSVRASSPPLCEPTVPSHPAMRPGSQVVRSTAIGDCRRCRQAAKYRLACSGRPAVGGNCGGNPGQPNIQYLATKKPSPGETTSPQRRRLPPRYGVAQPKPTERPRLQ